jgi:glycosyltransferase involved in cell wall biosynthesis
MERGRRPASETSGGEASPRAPEESVAKAPPAEAPAPAAAGGGQAYDVIFLLGDTPRIYGAERAMIRLAAGLMEAGLRVFAVLMREQRVADCVAVEAECVAAGIPHTTVKVAGRFSPGVVRHLADALQAGGRAVLHTAGPKADVHGRLAADLSHRPWVATVHGWLDRDVRERLYTRLDAHALQWATRILVLSQFHADELARRGLPRNRLSRIPPGVPDTGPIPREPDGLFRVGMLGRLSPEKNHRLLIWAALKLAGESAPHVLLAGDGPQRAALEKLVRAPELADRFEMTGYIAPADFFRRIDVLVCCSRTENMPQSVLEAMIAGRPVIASRVGGLPELVADGETGFLFDADDENALAAKLTELSARPDLVKAMGEAGRQRALELFSLPAMIKAHVALYKQLA